jgi:prepilin-type N-terminal cleavage/methylation domain-containing protein
MGTYKKSSPQGFSLVEVCLALLVIGLGLLAVFGLFPSGLAMNKRSIDETQCGMFANDVFDSFRAGFDADPNLWQRMGSPFGDDLGFGATAGFAWAYQAPNVTVMVVAANAPFQKVVYSNWINVEGTTWLMVPQNAWRYRLTFDSVPGRAGRVKYANLQVLNGEYGLSNNIVEFYTEYYNFRSPRYP